MKAFWLALALCMATLTASAVTITDNFSTPQQPFIWSNSGRLSDTSTVGTRTLFVAHTSGEGQILSEVVGGSEPTGRRYTFEEGTDTTGTARVTYAFPAPISLVADLGYQFRIDVEKGDVAGGTLQFFIQTGATTYVYGSALALPVIAGPAFLPVTLTDTIDTSLISNAIGMGFYITGAPDKDIALDNFNASPVPEPGTYALMGLGLAGLAYLRRRK